MEEEFRVKWGVGIRSKRNEGMLSVEANGARRSPSTNPGKCLMSCLECQWKQLKARLEEVSVC